MSEVADLPPRESTPAGGEAWSDMIARVARALTHGLTRTGEDSLPVFVAHSGVIRAARHLLSRDPFGPSPRNTTPILFLPGPSGWRWPSIWVCRTFRSSCSTRTTR